MSPTPPAKKIPRLIVPESVSDAPVFPKNTEPPIVLELSAVNETPWVAKLPVSRPEFVNDE
jgi:hypothetical protein